MTQFVFAETVQESPDIVSAAIGASAVAPLTANDLGKAVKLGPNNNYILAANGDDIGGTLAAVNPDTVNDGFAFGSVSKKGRRTAVIDAAELGTAAPGATVVAGTQTAADTAGGLVVELGAGAVYKWVVVSLLAGDGTAGTTVLIERV